MQLHQLNLTWQSLGPLDGGDDLAAAQPVEGGHEAGGGVGQAAVVAGVDGVRLDGLEQRQHGGHQLRHALGHQRAALHRRAGGLLRRIAGLGALHPVVLLGFAGCAGSKRGVKGEFGVRKRAEVPTFYYSFLS